MRNEPLLEADISVDYPGKPAALQNIAFQMRPGEILGLVGESGSGKSTIALALLRLVDLRRGTVRGKIRFGGRDLVEAGERELRRLRGKEIAVVLQSPMAALNPALRIGTQLREAWRAHSAEGWRVGRERARELFASMGLAEDDDFLRRLPRQLSVGQGQRVAIALGVMHRPRLLIADEPTSALDPLSGAEILNLFRRFNRDYGTAILYISHDLISVAGLCHSVAVLRDGRLIEWGPVERVLTEPRQEYTKQIVAGLIRRPFEERHARPHVQEACPATLLPPPCLACGPDP